jgi:hypothetical protein
MTAAEKATALLDSLTLFEINQLSPDKRRQFAALCRIWSWQLESRPAWPLKADVLQPEQGLRLEIGPDVDAEAVR